MGAQATVPVMYVEGYKTNIFMLAEQKVPKLWGRSRMEDQKSVTDWYDRIGSVDAQDPTGRFADTPILDVPHTKRGVSLSDAEFGTMMDKFDNVRILNDPKGAYTVKAVQAMNRRKDDIFIAAALGSAQERLIIGTGTTTTKALPSSQKLCAVNGVDAVSGLNIYTLTLVGQLFDDNDIDEDEKKYFAWGPKQKRQLLNETKATSSDYASVKALTKGQINDFMGFEFTLSTRLPVTSAAVTTINAITGDITTGAITLATAARRCFAWTEDGMLSAAGIDLYTDIGPRRDKKGNIGIYVCHSVGSVRMEEVQVVEVLVTEAL